jgi:hypothetical protein
MSVFNLARKRSFPPHPLWATCGHFFGPVTITAKCQLQRNLKIHQSWGYHMPLKYAILLAASWIKVTSATHEMLPLIGRLLNNMFKKNYWVTKSRTNLIKNGEQFYLKRLYIRVIYFPSHTCGHFFGPVTTDSAKVVCSGKNPLVLK